MEYVIFGMGGVGASVAERLTRNGKQVTAIARGAHLEELQKNGLRVETTQGTSYQVDGLRAMTSLEYQGSPDMVFVCVKGYSIESTYPFLERVCASGTVVIPLLNLFGTGQQMSIRLQECMGDAAPLVTDGCIYVAAEVPQPGAVLEYSPLCRIIFGMPYTSEQPAKLRAISEDAGGRGLECILSENIRRDALKKFSYVSPMGATAIIHDSDAGDVQSQGPACTTFAAAIREVVAIGEAMGILFDEDMVQVNLEIVSGLDAASTTSMQRDLRDGKPSEYDGLIEEVIRLGEHYGVDTPTYILAQERARMRFGL